jgi:hypothetical protein
VKDTHNFRCFILVRVRLHVPDDLMGEQLRKLGRLNDVSLNVAKSIVSERLDNLVDVEEHDIYRVALKCSHSILYNEGMVAVRRHEKRHRRDGIHRSPIQQVLSLSERFFCQSENTYLELEGHITRQLATQKYLESIWLIQDLLREVEYLEANLTSQAGGLEAFDEVYGDGRVLRPSRLQVGGNSSLGILVQFSSREMGNSHREGHL